MDATKLYVSWSMLRMGWCVMRQLNSTIAHIEAGPFLVRDEAVAKLNELAQAAEANRLS